MARWKTETKQLAAGAPAERKYTPFQEHALSELRRVAARTYAYRREPSRDAFLCRLLLRALFSAYRDCQDEGLEIEARQILDAAAEHTAEMGVCSTASAA